MKYAIALLVGLALLAPSCSSAPSSVPDALVGTWQGDGCIIVTWCEQQRLPIRLKIDDRAGVSGTVGDATLVGGRLRSNRGGIGRALHVKTDWIVVADLEGALVAAENIRRDGIKLPLDLVAERLEGGAHSTGMHVGTKDTMVLSAAEIVLRRE